MNPAAQEQEQEQSVIMAEAMQQAVSALEQGFQAIYRERMKDVPIVNSNLSVSAKGFRPWGDYWLGTLLTPWFLNLVMLPKEKSSESVSVGSKCQHALPCGDFTFIASHEPELGDFWTCSLMSPVLELTDQQQAEAVMQESLAVIFEGADDEEWDAEKNEIERFQLSQKQQHLQKIQEEQSISAVEKEEDAQKTCSRREFFSRCIGKAQK